jgi:hypothetical protein
MIVIRRACQGLVGQPMKPTVYLDATIPSFYYEDRPGTIVQAWREITTEFWDQAREHYECFTPAQLLEIEP